MTSTGPRSPVRLDTGSGPTPILTELAERTAAAAGSIDASLEVARWCAEHVDRPGAGRTLDTWSALATLAAVDLTTARVVEPHLDALAILDEASADGHPVIDAPGATWGVFAAEGAGARLVATRSPDGWTLDGRKPWCSLAGRLSHALVTAWVTERDRQLFAMDLRHPGAVVAPGGWVSRGLADVTSGPIDLSDVPATPVGPAGWYLDRAGFAWGGIGVAAVWHGGAVGVARRLAQASREREPDLVAHLHLGTVDAALHATRALLAETARRIDAGVLSRTEASLLALRCRQVSALSAETVLRSADHALGPAPLAFEEDHARRVADLHLYLRQWHAARDQAALGSLLLTQGPDPW